LMQDGTPQSVFARTAELSSYHLEAPALVRLFSGLQARGVKVDSYVSNPAAGVEALAPWLSPALSGEPARPAPADASDSNSILETAGLNFTYMSGTPFEYQALRDVNFRAPAHQITGLVGSTGSGKTTLIQHFNGLLQPGSGIVKVQGRDIKGYKANLMELRKKVGLVFQFPESQLFEENVYADVAFAPLNFGVPKADIEPIVKAALEVMDLDFESYRDRSPFSLSGGEMRKAAIAGVLAARPEILVMDEPLAGLDAASRKHLLATLSHLQQDQGCSLVIISHNMEELFRASHYLGILHEGKLAYNGRLEGGVSQVSALAGLGLELPAYVQMLQMLKARGFPVPARALTVEQAIEEIVAISK
jgi:energy-coupling factor transporter ATPase